MSGAAEQAGISLEQDVVDLVNQVRRKTWEHLNMYVIMYGGTILSYFLINKLLVRRINKMLPAEVLKNRE